MDAFTRHVEPAYRKRGMQWATVDGKTRLLVGGKINRFIPNPTFDPVSSPGALDEYFRGRNPGRRPRGALRRAGSASAPEYRNRDARLALMDTQGMEGAHLPTDPRRRHGAGAHRRPAGAARGVPRVQPLDGRGLGLRLPEPHLRRPLHHPRRPRSAARELQWALDRDARFVVMVGGPVRHRAGALARRPDVRPVLAAGQRLRHHRLLPRRRQRLHQVPRRLGRERLHRGVPAKRVPQLWPRPTRCRTPSPTTWPAACSTGSRTCGSRPSRSARPGCSTCSRSSPRPSARPRTCSPRTPGRPSNGTSGCPRSMRTSSPACSG